MRGDQNITAFVKRYAWCGLYFVLGGLLFSVIAYNVIGQAVGYANVVVGNLIPGITIGAFGGLIISFLVIRNRHNLVRHLEAQRDITDRMQNEIAVRQKIEDALRARESQLRLITDNIPALVAYIDSSFTVRFANQHYAEYAGLTPEAIVGKTLDQAFGRRGFEVHREYALAALAGKITSNEGAMPMRDGSTRYFRATRVPHFDEDGTVPGYFLIYVDLTEHHEQEAKLRQAQKMESVGQLTGGVAHDFNNLLTVIEGNLELVAERTDDKDIARMAATATRAARRGADLTQRLLAFSRKQALAPEVISLDKLAEGMIDILRRTLGETIEISLSDGNALWLCSADAGQMENALLNLAINARNAMPNGGQLNITTSNTVVSDAVASEHDVPPGDYVLMAVTDTGVGMPAEVREQAFDPFFTTKAVGEGSGLGLSMVHGFIIQSGGFVTIDSSEGEGTTVTMYLPRCFDGMPDMSADGKTDAENSGPPLSRGERVLVVEDDPDVRAMTVTMLSDLGYETIEASDGHQALALLERTPAPNLLFTDMVLAGGLSGADIARRARTLSPETKILFTSGYADDVLDHETDDKDLNTVPMVTKPFSKAELAEKLRSVLS